MTIFIVTIIYFITMMFLFIRTRRKLTHIHVTGNTVLKVERGDTILLQTDSLLTTEEYEHIVRRVKESIPFNCEVLVLDNMTSVLSCSVLPSEGMVQ
jgi:hypothetical protein